MTLERFRREARAAARLHHTNIVPVFEIGQDGDVRFYAMQFIQGQSLDAVITELRHLRIHSQSKGNGDDQARSRRETRALAPSVARSILTGGFLPEGDVLSSSGIVNARSAAKPRSAALALAKAVAVGEDVTEAGPLSEFAPDSSPSPTPMSSAVLPGGAQLSVAEMRRQVLYRSVAHIGRQAAAALAHANARGVIHRDIKPSNLLLDTDGVVWVADFGLAKAEDDGLTETGDVLGTIRYMAPERFSGQADPRSDVYALGMTLYELLLLRPAFDSPNRLALIDVVKNVDPARPRSIDPRIPLDLETIVLKAVEKDPKARYASADALNEDLRRFLADEPILARQVSTAERYWRWARRNPGIAWLGGAVTALLVVVAVGSLLAAGRFASLAKRESKAATAERLAHVEADQDRKTAEKARADAQAETYRAMLSEVKALRAGHQPGWREEALANLARLAVMPTPRRDLVELRTEAVASIGEFEVKEVARFEGRDVESVYSLDFSPDSKTLVTASEVGVVDLWDVPNRMHARRLGDSERRGAVKSWIGGRARFLPSGFLAYIAGTGNVAFLNASGQPTARPSLNGGAQRLYGWKTIVKVAFSRWDGATGASASTTPGAGRCGKLSRGPQWLRSAPSGQRLAQEDADHNIELHPTDGHGPAVTLGPHRDTITQLAFSPDGERIASSSGQTVTLWNVATREEVLTLRGHKESVTGFAFSPDGDVIATSCGDHTTRIWDLRSGQALAVIPGPWFMRAVAFSPDGGYLAASADPGPVCLYQLKGRREQRRLAGHIHGVQRVVFHPHLPRLASCSDHHAIILFDAVTSHPLRRWMAHKIWVAGLAYSPDGSLIASSSGGDPTPGFDFSLCLWDADRGTLRKRLPGNTAGVWALAFDPTSRRLASGDEGGTVLLFDVGSGRILRREKVGDSPVTSVVFHDGGRQLLVGLRKGPVALFDLELPGLTRRIELPEGCGRLTVDNHRNRALVGDNRGAVIALSLPDLTVIHRLDAAHDQSIESLALSPDGRLLATGGSDRRVVLRDPFTFKALLAFPAWTGVVKDLGFDASGHWLAFAGADSDIDLWDLEMLHDELAAAGLAWDHSTDESADRRMPP